MSSADKHPTAPLHVG